MQTRQNEATFTQPGIIVPAPETKKKTPAAEPTAEMGLVYLCKRQGKTVLVRATAEPRGATGKADDLLPAMATKEIDGYVGDMLGAPVGKAKDKASAIRRFFRAAYANLPLEQVEAPAETKKGKRERKPKEPRPARTLTVRFDPTDEAMAKAFEDLAPQGKACVLAVLGLKHAPKEAREKTVEVRDLPQWLEAHREPFGDSKAKLSRAFAYYAQTLEAAGFLARSGQSRKRATDDYSYCFKRLGDEATAGMSPIARLVSELALGKATERDAAELTGKELKARLTKAKASGKFETRREPFLAFQRVEAEMVAAGALRVKAS